MRQIKDLRISKGLSQEGLATISGLSLRTIQRIENGEAAPRIQTLQTLAEALEVELEELTDQLSGSALVEDKVSRPLWQYALLNSACYILFPLIALIVVLLLRNQAEKTEKPYFGGLLLLNIITFSIFSILFVVAIMFKLNGWSGSIELATHAYLGTAVIVCLGSFILLFFSTSKNFPQS